MGDYILNKCNREKTLKWPMHFVRKRKNAANMNEILEYFHYKYIE